MFQFVPKKVIGTNHQMVNAYVVQCPRSQTAAVESSLITNQFQPKDQNHLVPFKWKWMKPAIFDEFIRLQCQLYQDLWLIKMEGITLPMMEHIKELLRDLPGVKWLLPGQNYYDSRGEWTLQVSKRIVAMMFQELQCQWNDLLSQIPQDLVQPGLVHASPPATSDPPKMMTIVRIRMHLWARSAPILQSSTSAFGTHCPTSTP